MTWKQLQFIKQNEKRLLYNSATGNSNDNSTDTGATKDPNNYLVPKVGKARSVLEFTLLILLIAVALKQLKIF